MYRFVTTWRLEASPERVWAALSDAASYPEWWPGFERVDVLEAGAPDGVGRRAHVVMRGPLPYRLEFETVGREAREPDRAVIGASGQLVGEGRWRLSHAGGVTTTTYIWEVDAAKRWMRLLEPFGRPAFTWNHHVAMHWGAEGLARHLDTRLLGVRSEPPVRARDWLPLSGLVVGLAGALTATVRRRQVACRSTGGSGRRSRTRSGSCGAARCRRSGGRDR
ncbi:MAG TPA: SRPBCC family protein [Egibacteraceae bacterium]|jgi:carbon monoxide dehydrogenase subunit G|nr:SRPBCC family protein [Egibacteraceae bacterium]